MSSDPNYEWEQLLDIDDSDLPLTPVLRPYNSHVRETSTTTTTQNTGGSVQVEKTPVKIITGPASVVQVEEKPIVVEDVGEDEDFKGDIENYLKNEKLKQVVAIIKSCTSNAIGSALILANVFVFSPKPSMHYLNITMRNAVKVFHKDSVPGNGTGVCWNVTHQEMADEEALNLALDEEVRQARVDQEWLKKCWKEAELDEEHER
ncbi:hypothetical protein Tco_1147621 [Tanacetum coccineum]